LTFGTFIALHTIRLSTNMPVKPVNRSSQRGSAPVSAITDTSARSNRGMQDGGAHVRYGLNKDDKCGSCGQEVLESDQSLECEICKFWHHVGCEEVPPVLYEAIEQDKNGIIHWYCRKCNCSVVKIIEQISSLDKRQSATEAKVRDIDMRVDDLESNAGSITGRIDKLDLDVGLKASFAQADAVNARVDVLGANLNRVAGDIVNIHKKVMLLHDELEEKQRRLSNLVIRGLPEREGDESGSVAEVFSSLGFAHDSYKLIDVRRLGAIARELNPVNVGNDTAKVISRPRPLRIILSDRSVRNSILQKGPELRNLKDSQANFNPQTVYICPDQTKLEREKDIALRQELRDRRQINPNWVIRKGRLVLRNPDTYQ
jgi:hypothetical protein